MTCTEFEGHSHHPSVFKNLYNQRRSIGFELLEHLIHTLFRIANLKTVMHLQEPYFAGFV